MALLTNFNMSHVFKIYKFGKLLLINTAPSINLINKQLESNYSMDSEPDKLYKKLEIEVKGHDPAVLKSYESFLEMAAKELNITVGKKWTPPRDITRYTLLRSVFVHKKHMNQYETRTHFRVIQFKHLTGSTLETFLEYIQRNLPEGIAMKTSKTELVESFL